MPPNSGRRASIYSLSPTEMKKLLHDLLAQRHWSKLSPSQQRQLNGATGRIPLSFYDRVWFILQRSRHGIRIAGSSPPLPCLRMALTSVSWQQGSW